MRRKINRGTHTYAYIIPYIILYYCLRYDNNTSAHIVQSRDAAAAIVRERCSRAAATRDLWRGRRAPVKLVDDKRIKTNKRDI